MTGMLNCAINRMMADALAGSKPVPGYQCELGHGVSKSGVRERQESERKTIEIKLRFNKM